MGLNLSVVSQKMSKSMDKSIEAMGMKMGGMKIDDRERSGTD